MRCRSFIIKIKSQGPNFVPWGTPDGMFSHSEKQSLDSFTRCSLDVKTFKSQLDTYCGMESCRILLARIWYRLSRKLCDSQTEEHVQTCRSHQWLKPKCAASCWQIRDSKLRGIYYSQNGRSNISFDYKISSASFDRIGVSEIGRRWLFMSRIGVPFGIGITFVLQNTR